MAKIKELAMQLAAYVYIYHLTEDDIVSRYRGNHSGKKEDEVDTWLRKQIAYVKDNPDIFRKMAE